MNCAIKIEEALIIFHQTWRISFHVSGRFEITVFISTECSSWGEDTDDVETIYRTADFVKSSGIDTLQFLILTPLPGTPLFHDMIKSGRVLYGDWSKYNVQHVVFRP